MLSGTALKRTLDVLSAGVVAVAAGAMIWTMVVGGDARPATIQAAEMVEGLRIPGKIGHSKGQAAVAIVEFAEYQCPYCRAYARSTYASVQRELVASGEARYVFVDFPLDIHPLAMGASEAAECAGRQGKFWEMHGRLFAADEAILPVGVIAQADALHLDRSLFESCINGEASEAIATSVSLGKTFGVDGTPTFFLGLVQKDGSIELRERIVGVTTLETLRAEVAKVSAQGTALLDRTRRIRHRPS